jgi:hypothetical protein
MSINRRFFLFPSLVLVSTRTLKKLILMQKNIQRIIVSGITTGYHIAEVQELANKHSTKTSILLNVGRNAFGKHSRASDLGQVNNFEVLSELRKESSAYGILAMVKLPQVFSDEELKMYTQKINSLNFDCVILEIAPHETRGRQPIVELREKNTHVGLYVGKNLIEHFERKPERLFKNYTVGDKKEYPNPSADFSFVMLGQNLTYGGYPDSQSKKEFFRSYTLEYASHAKTAEKGVFVSLTKYEDTELQILNEAGSMANVSYVWDSSSSWAQTKHGEKSSPLHEMFENVSKFCKQKVPVSLH